MILFHLLQRVSFSVNGRREAIYRGSTRLLPLFKQMQQQKKNAEGSNNKHFARYVPEFTIYTIVSEY